VQPFPGQHKPGCQPATGPARQDMRLHRHLPDSGVLLTPARPAPQPATQPHLTNRQ